MATQSNELIFIPIMTGCGRTFLCITILFKLISRESPGTPKMRSIASFIQEGANAFLRREVRTIAYFLIPLAVLLFFLLG
jgi:K(+)-stimulated pyrophosphate-energized sodium pump